MQTERGCSADVPTLLTRLVMLFGGLFLFALATALSLQCNLGAASWTVLHDGISRQTPLSIGAGEAEAVVADG